MNVTPMFEEEYNELELALEALEAVASARPPAYRVVLDFQQKKVFQHVPFDWREQARVQIVELRKALRNVEITLERAALHD